LGDKLSFFDQNNWEFFGKKTFLARNLTKSFWKKITNFLKKNPWSLLKGVTKEGGGSTQGKSKDEAKHTSQNRSPKGSTQLKSIWFEFRNRLPKIAFRLSLSCSSKIH